MQICPNCAYNNRPGVVFCENCGTSLIGSQATAETKSLDKTDENTSTVAEKVDVEVIQDAGVLGSEVFPPGATLRIEINDGAYVLKFNPQEKETILFGRTDPSTGVTPQVDLTPYAGYRMGVSRRHAEIRKSSAQDNTLEVWDLGSSNGTFLNGERLISHRPYVLSDGDEIQLGQLRVRAFFQKEVTKTLDASKVDTKAAEAPKSNGETLKITADAVRDALQRLEGTSVEPSPKLPEIKPVAESDVPVPPTSPAGESPQKPSDVKPVAESGVPVPPISPAGEPAQKSSDVKPVAESGVPVPPISPAGEPAQKSSDVKPVAESGVPVPPTSPAGEPAQKSSDVKPVAESNASVPPASPAVVSQNSQDESKPMDSSIPAEAPKSENKASENSDVESVKAPVPEGDSSKDKKPEQ